MWLSASNSQGFCDFEDGLCTWINEDGKDELDWNIDYDGTSTDDTGPSVDHTLGTEFGEYHRVPSFSSMCKLQIGDPKMYGIYRCFPESLVSGFEVDQAKIDAALGLQDGDMYR